MPGTFRYRWFGKGDAEAALGLFFDAFSKVLAAIGIMTVSLGFPMELVVKQLLPGLGFSIFIGNLGYSLEAQALAKREQRQNVTAQPFGIGSGQFMGWLFLIMAPVYWQTGDARMAYRVGLAACFVGSFVEMLGAFLAPWIMRTIHRSALLGNMSATAFVWLSLAGIATVFNRPVVAALPCFIVVLDYLGRSKQKRRIPSGLLAVLLGTTLSWVFGFSTLERLRASTASIGFYLPWFRVEDIFHGIKAMIPYLPVIIPLQINNFLSTLQALESASAAGDNYPYRKSMLMDGLFTCLGSLLGTPFPNTVYFGHPGWKRIGARAGYSLIVGAVTLVLCSSGLTSFLAELIPYEAVIILLIYIGLVSGAQSFEVSKRKFHVAILLGFIPLLFSYIYSQIESALAAAGSSVTAVGAEAFNRQSLAIMGIGALQAGSFLSSLLWTAILIALLDDRQGSAILTLLFTALCSAVGLIHGYPGSFVIPLHLIMALIYLLLALYIYVTSSDKRRIFRRGQVFFETNPLLAAESASHDKGDGNEQVVACENDEQIEGIS